jgi:hypothetical protein
MKKLNLYTSVAVSLLLLSVFLLNCGKTDKTPVSINDLEKIVDTYCMYISEGNYSEAYNKCMNAQFKKDISLNDFSAAHEKRKKEIGTLVSKKLTFDKNSTNIFSGIKEFQLTYELKYPEAVHHEHIKLNNEDGKYLIEGTYTSSSSKTLRFMVW